MGQRGPRGRYRVEGGPKPRQIGVRLPEHVYRWLERRANDNGLSVAAYLRELLVDQCPDAPERDPLTIDWINDAPNLGHTIAEHIQRLGGRVYEE